MQPTNLHDIEKLVESVKEIVEITQDKVEKTELFQNVIMGQVRTIKDQQSVMNKKLDKLGEQSSGITEQVALLTEDVAELKELKNTVNNQLLPSVTHTETILTAYGDMYIRNDDNIRKIEKRVQTTEGKLEITPRPEHILADVQ